MTSKDKDVDKEKVYAGLGAAEIKPTIHRGFDPAGGGLSPEDYFVLTRIDGRTSLRQLVMISGFPEAKALGILKKLRGSGALLFPGETTPPPEVLAPPAAPAASAAPMPAIDPNDPRLAEDVDLTVEQKRSILAKHLSLRTATHFQVLEVPQNADKKALKDGYRRMSKDFHPDRFFGKRLGTYKVMLTEIFDLASSAMETLSDPEQREGYLASLGGVPTTPLPEMSTPAPRKTSAAPAPAPAAPRLRDRDRANLLYEEACMDHVSGELTRALEKFAAAIALDAQPRYLRRAAECALKAQDLRVSEEYAKKATEMDAHNAASHRILGKVLAAAGRPGEARLRFEQARRLDPDNPHIAAELRELDDSLR